MKPSIRLISVALFITLFMGLLPAGAPPARAEWTVGDSIAAGISVTASAYFLHKAYENYQSRSNSGSDYRESGGTYYSGDDDERDSDSGYSEWSEAQSEAARRAEIQREFSNQMARNGRMVAKLKGTFDQRLDVLKTTTTAKYLCMSFCGSYHKSTVLAARIVSSTGDSIDAANKALGDSCTGKDESLFDELGNKSDNYSLRQPTDACIPAQATENDILAEAKTDHRIVHNYVYEVDILPDLTPVSDEFKVEVARELAQANALSDNHTISDALEAANALGYDIPGLDMKTDHALSKPGYVVMNNGSNDPQERITMIADSVSDRAYGTKTIAESPVSVEVHCKDETHRVRSIQYIYIDGEKVQKKAPSDDYIAMLSMAAAAPPLSNASCQAPSTK
jgi:hypothetical protein